MLTTGWLDKLESRQDTPHFIVSNFGDPLTPHRILLATDLPFWRRSTGAEQRIARLVEFLSRSGYRVRVFFLSATTQIHHAHSELTDEDRRIIEAQKLDVEVNRSSQPPKQLSKKIAWYLKAIKHQFGKDHFGKRKSSPGPSSKDTLTNQTAASTTTLADYRWPWAINAFQESIQSFAPDSVIIEYVKLSYLLEALTFTQRKKIHCLLDTHDILHLRNEQFQERGLVHWLDINRKEETEVLRLFDTILAIQIEEANLFRDLVPEKNVLVCGHTPEPLPAPKKQRSTSETFTIGYLASANASNLRSFTNFISQSWTAISDQCEIRLIVAGKICDAISEASPSLLKEYSNITTIGSVNELAEFYHQIDVVINPVEFGTGLKIKNCEAVFFGKPLVTTTMGLDGLPAKSGESLMVCNSPRDWNNCLIQLAQNPSERLRRQNAAAKLSQLGFSDQEVYSELDVALRSKK